MERHTPCARSLPGPITQTDGRFRAVHSVFVGFMVASSVWLPHREHLKATADCGRAGSRSGIRLKEPY